MFNSITGTLTFKTDETVGILTSGIEWEIATTAQSISQLSDIGATATLYTFLHHRDDQMKIFGFSTVKERDLFLNLLKVDSVGPRLALKALSGIATDSFVSAIEDGDVDRLVAVPGLGRKTAQKIFLTLKGKLVLTETRDEYSDIVNALVGMGFDKKNARQAVVKALESLEPDDLQREELERELLRRSIKLASRTGGAYESRRDDQR
jgi:Holliday junction DNA helicase RuvA